MQTTVHCGHWRHLLQDIGYLPEGIKFTHFWLNCKHINLNHRRSCYFYNTGSFDGKLGILDQLLHVCLGLQTGCEVHGSLAWFLGICFMHLYLWIRLWVEPWRWGKLSFKPRAWKLCFVHCQVGGCWEILFLCHSWLTFPSSFSWYTQREQWSWPQWTPHQQLLLKLPRW